MKIATIGLQLDINKGALCIILHQETDFWWNDSWWYSDDVKKNFWWILYWFFFQGIKKIQADKNGYPVLVELRNNGFGFIR